jgi:hypothetical protein
MKFKLADRGSDGTDQDCSAFLDQILAKVVFVTTHSMINRFLQSDFSLRKVQISFNLLMTEV